MIIQDYKAVLFDLDGTLLDTAPDLGFALNVVLKEYGQKPVDESQYREEASNGSKGLLKLGFGNKLVDYDFEELKQRFLSVYEQNICLHTQWFSQTESLITNIRQNNIKWGIVTNKPTFLTNILLSKLPLMKDADTIVCGDTLPVAKPHPEPLLHAAQLIDVNPVEILYVGDALRDIEAGKAAKMDTCTAHFGYIPKDEDAYEWNAKYDIQCLSELT